MSSVWSGITPKRVGTGLLIGLGVALLAVMALWLVPMWLTEDPHVSSPSDRHKAMADARTGVVAFIAVLGTLVGLYFTAKTFRASRDAQIAASNYANETLRLSERGEITDRYLRAVEQLGDDSPEICVGGIYALGQIMLDSPGRYEPPIVGVISAFIRRKAKRRDDLSVPWDEDEAERDEVKPSFRIQAALKVFVASRPTAVPPDLRDSDLRGARLRGAQLPGANLRRSYLHGAKLAKANLRSASLEEADLTKAELTDADLTGAKLVNADLTNAVLTDADLRGADLTGAKVANADFTSVRLIESSLTDAQLAVVRNGDKIQRAAAQQAGPPLTQQIPDPI